MCIMSYCYCQVPHAFQQQLSHEKTPTLCDTIPAFEAMSAVWVERQESLPIAADVIEKGVEKLAEYRNRVNLHDVPAYTLAMSE